MYREYRKIIHIDMDAFYASIEQRDNIKLRGKPVIVGGSPESRGVVATCSYEARRYGIHSAMPSKVAYKRCPYAIFVSPRFDVYKETSNQIREIFYKYTDLVEPLSWDEAYLDVTQNKHKIEYASKVAIQIKKDILKQTGLTSSAGVSYNKFLAKIASDYQKPNGLTIITPDKTEEILSTLPINKFFGVGKVTENTLRNLGVKNGEDLKKLSLYELEKVFKSRAYTFYQFARGIDEREVEPYRERKSVGSETTLKQNISIDSQEAIEIIDEVCKDVAYRISAVEKLGKTITLKVKYEDFTQITRSLTLEHPINKLEDIVTNTYSLINKVDNKHDKVRLLGVTLSNLVDKAEEYSNINFFDHI